jgi:AcrR family transcriptional regulator
MNKKENILAVALHLFSNQGFENTSTNLIAKKAAVSEGLIFRHFTNKEGLLKEIINEGFNQIRPYLDVILAENDPKKVIALTLELPIRIISEHRKFWKLQNSLMVQNEKFKKDFEENEFFKPLDTKILNAFKALELDNPEVEAETFFIFLTGLGFYLLENEDIDGVSKIIKSIKTKFSL